MYETCQCLVVYISIPFLISEKVKKACCVYIEHSKHRSDDCEEVDSNEEFDSTRYLFTSTVLAMKHKDFSGLNMNNFDILQTYLNTL